VILYIGPNIEPGLGGLEFKGFSVGKIRSARTVRDGFPLSLSAFTPFNVIGAFGVDLDFALNPDLIFQPAVRL
jgi:hypothetical protein